MKNSSEKLYIVKDEPAAYGVPPVNKGDMVKRAFKAAFPRTLPVMAGYIVLGAGFGIFLQSKGFNFLWAILMSISIYAGSMQYVAVDLLTGGATLVASALMTLMVNARHLFYGISMLDKYKGTGRKKPYLIYSLTDETYSLVCSPDIPEDVEPDLYYTFVSFLNQCYWVAGSAAGGLAGTLIAFDVTGIDFAMTALFVVIFIEQWLSTRQHIPAVIGVLTAVLCLLIFGPAEFVIPSMLSIVILLTVFRKPLTKEAESNA